ncbi:MAG: DUF1636 family protein [Erythrobacter sp.]
MQSVPQEIELLVCTRCRPEGAAPEGDVRSGAILFDQLTALGLDNIRVTPIECLSNCSRGCTIALRGPGRWTYIFGGFTPGADLATIGEGAEKYRSAPDGLVPWRERPEHFRKNCIARIPPLDLGEAEADGGLTTLTQTTIES